MMVEWIDCLKKRTAERNSLDLEILLCSLKELTALKDCPEELLRRICQYATHESLKRGVKLFRAGECGTKWYVILSGSVYVISSDSKGEKVVDILEEGSDFGAGVRNDNPRSATVITKENCQFLLVDKTDLKMLFDDYRNEILKPTPEESMIGTRGKEENPEKSFIRRNSDRSTIRVPNQRVQPLMSVKDAGRLLYGHLKKKFPQLMKDKVFHHVVYKQCCVGSELVDWLMSVASMLNHRDHAVGIWQTLVEEEILENVRMKHQFKDSDALFYRFRIARSDGSITNEELNIAINVLSQIGPDAFLRLLLSKKPSDRTEQDVEAILKELSNIDGVSQMSPMVKKRLAAICTLETYKKSGTTVIRQGDVADSWYIILKGSVEVFITGKGVVCSLNEGDDFGKLALVNRAPRAATVITNQDNCCFAKVDKDDFNLILQHCEKNIIRLKENDKEVLVLERTARNEHGSEGSSVIEGAPHKILDYLIETRSTDTTRLKVDGEFIPDFYFTYPLFMSKTDLYKKLLTLYRRKAANLETAGGNSIEFKAKIIHTIIQFYLLDFNYFNDDPETVLFINELREELVDNAAFEEATSLQFASQCRESLYREDRIVEVMLEFMYESENRLYRNKVPYPPLPLTGRDKINLDVYQCDHTKIPLEQIPFMFSVREIIAEAKKRMKEDSSTTNEVYLCEVKSNKEIIILEQDEKSIASKIGINSKLFLAVKGHVDTCTPLSLQNPTGISTPDKQIYFENLNSTAIAHHLTAYDYELLSKITMHEFLCYIDGDHRRDILSTNLDYFLRRYNEIEYWVITEICLTQTLYKRAQVIKKFIKIAEQCKQLNNLHSCTAIVGALLTTPITRLTQTFEKIQIRILKKMKELQSIMDPSRNYRTYRSMAREMKPPFIPYTPLLIRDLLAIDTNNETYKAESKLINFEKMRLISARLQPFRKAQDHPYTIEKLPYLLSRIKEYKYIRNLTVIDNETMLEELSNQIERH